MLTKQDRQNLLSDFKQVFATKDNLKNLVTKDDAKLFATKNDLKGLVTKDDLKRELKPIKRKLNQVEKKKYPGSEIDV